MITISYFSEWMLMCFSKMSSYVQSEQVGDVQWLWRRSRCQVLQTWDGEPDLDGDGNPLDVGRCRRLMVTKGHHWRSRSDQFKDGVEDQGDHHWPAQDEDHWPGLRSDQDDNHWSVRTKQSASAHKSCIFLNCCKSIEIEKNRIFSISHRFKPHVVGEQLVEYLGGVDAGAVLLPLLNDLGAHHVQLLLHVVQPMVEPAQGPAVFAHRKVLENKSWAKTWFYSRRSYERGTDPIEHGLRLGGQGCQGVAVVGLPEHLQHGLGLALLARPAHRRRTGLGTQLVQARPRCDAMGESEPRKCFNLEYFHGNIYQSSFRSGSLLWLKTPPECPCDISPCEQLVLPQQGDAVDPLDVGDEVVVWKIINNSEQSPSMWESWSWCLHLLQRRSR